MESCMHLQRAVLKSSRTVKVLLHSLGDQPDSNEEVLYDDW